MIETYSPQPNQEDITSWMRDSQVAQAEARDIEAVEHELLISVVQE